MLLQEFPGEVAEEFVSALESLEVALVRHSDLLMILAGQHSRPGACN
jgi:hypothetical protein